MRHSTKMCRSTLTVSWRISSHLIIDCQQPVARESLSFHSCSSWFFHLPLPAPSRVFQRLIRKCALFCSLEIRWSRCRSSHHCVPCVHGDCLALTLFSFLPLCQALLLPPSVRGMGQWVGGQGSWLPASSSVFQGPTLREPVLFPCSQCPSESSG